MQKRGGFGKAAMASIATSAKPPRLCVKAFCPAENGCNSRLLRHNTRMDTGRPMDLDTMLAGSHLDTCERIALREGCIRHEVDGVALVDRLTEVVEERPQGD